MKWNLYFNKHRFSLG